MANGYKSHINECEDYLRALGNAWCPICMIDLQSSGRMMIHLKFTHKMLDYNQQDEPVEDVVINEDEYLLPSTRKRSNTKIPRLL